MRITKHPHRPNDKEICDLEPVSSSKTNADSEYEVCIVTDKNNEKSCELREKPIIPIIPAPLKLDTTICTGVFNNCGSRTGWNTGTWTPQATANTATLTHRDWVNVGTGVTSPDCITDLTFTIDHGNFYILLRNLRLYYWVDYRLLVNGAAVLTRTSDRYIYEDERSNPTDLTVQFQMRQAGTSVDHRDNIPAGATVQAQVRFRYRFTGAQDNALGRVIGALRSQTIYNFSPNQTITDASLI